MPNFDKTGPTGQGPGTGKGLGSCARKNKTGQPIFRGRGMGRGMGGKCCGRGFLADSIIPLEDEEKILENRLEAVRRLRKNSNPKK